MHTSHEVLDLSNLHAKGIDSGAFKGFATLRKIDLSGNELKELPQGLFGKVGKCKISQQMYQCQFDKSFR